MKGWVIMKSPEEWEGTRLGLAIPIHTQLRLSNQGQGWWWCHWVGWCCCCCWALPSRKWQGGSALTSSPCLSSSNLSSGTAAPVLILHQYTKCAQYIYYTYNALWQSFNGRCDIQNFQLFNNFERKYHFHFLFQWFLPQTPLVKAMKKSKIHIFQTLNAIFAY